MSKNNGQTPLEHLRSQKRKYKKQYLSDEERLARNWNYLTNNTSTVLLNTIFNSPKKASDNKDVAEQRIQTPFGSVGSLSTVFSGIASSLPMIWEIVQPLLINMAIKKIKGLFSSKKKRKKER